MWEMLLLTATTECFQTFRPNESEMIKLHSPTSQKKVPQKFNETPFFSPYFSSHSIPGILRKIAVNQDF